MVADGRQQLVAPTVAMRRWQAVRVTPALVVSSSLDSERFVGLVWMSCESVAAVAVARLERTATSDAERPWNSAAAARMAAQRTLWRSCAAMAS